MLRFELDERVAAPAGAGGLPSLRHAHRKERSSIHPCSRSLAVSGGSLRLRLFLAIAASLLLPAASVRAGIAETVDITFPVTFPDFTGRDATITVNEEPCPISVRLALDAKGKYVCQDGGCTVGGIPVVAKGSVKAVSDGAGGLEYLYTATLKSPPGAEAKVSLKVAGSLSSLDLAPDGPGPWFCIDVDHYQLEPNFKTLGKGRSCFTITAIERFEGRITTILGTFEIKATSHQASGEFIAHPGF